MKIITIILTFIVLTSLSAHSQKRDNVNVLTSASNGTKIVKSAKVQIGKTLHYVAAYQSISYPNGDIPIKQGVCTDVVIRALRSALKYDLQKQVHLDMRKNFSKYPKIWNLKKTDKNIDHRRVPNLMTFFKRKGFSLPITKKVTDYKPGDLVTCNVGNRPHIMIVSDTTSSNGIPLIIHNIGSGTKLENLLFDFKITGHYRLKF